MAAPLVFGPVEDVPLWGTSASCAAANRRRGGLPTRRWLPACPTLSAPFEAVTELVSDRQPHDDHNRVVLLLAAVHGRHGHPRLHRKSLARRVRRRARV